MSDHSATSRTDGALAALARFCHRRRRLVLLAWIIGVAAVAFAGFGYGAASDNDFSGGDSGSAKAQALIERHFPERQGDTLTLAIKASKGIDDPAARRRIEKVVADLDASPLTGPVTSPYQDATQVTPDRRIARMTIPLTDKEVKKTAVKPLVDEVKDASGDGVTLGLGGERAEKAETPPQGPAEGVGVLTAAVILFVSFGSLVAMGLPIATALMAILGGIALIRLVGHLVPAPDFTVLVAALVGLGVGIDYALFIVTRYREALQDGDEPESATMIAAVTLLPALLGFTGRRINSLRPPRRTSRPRSAERRPPAERWAVTVQRRPLLAAVLAGAGLLVLAAPALSMRLSLPDASVQPRDRSSYTSYAILSEGFGPGYGAPLIFATRIGSADADLRPVVEAVGRTDGIASVTPARISRDGRAATFMAFPKTGSQDEATADLVHELRDDVLPKAPGGAEVQVGGPNAAAIDVAEDVGSRLPLMVAVVLALSLVLLIALVRSVTIAVQAAVMNLLSIGAAYGVLVAVVQWGWLGSALGFPTEMPITTWVPMMMFPLLFGLSMDYEVFLISRVREEYERTGDTRAAVTRGLGRTAKVITAAAAIMIAVFGTSLLGSDVSVKQIGLGMAVAVLIDATVVRMILVPAVMELCGRANWWMPGRRPPKTAPAQLAEEVRA
jgi:RND superfamily putative drug exporter